MKLSTRSRYGLRAMVAIARQENSRSTSKLVAKEEDVSKKYLDAILAELRAAGLLTAVRGVRGGYGLARPPDQITAADVVKVLEGEIALVPCVTDGSYCKRVSRCPTHDVWRAASAAVLNVLSRLTLAELAVRAGTSGQELRRQLQPQWSPRG